MTSKIAEVADHFSKHPTKPVWTVNGEISIHVAAVTATKSEGKRLVWKFRGKRETSFDVLVIARLKPEAGEIVDYYVFPGTCATPIRIFEQNPWSVEIHRFDDLRFLDLACRRSKLSDLEN